MRRMPLLVRAAMAAALSACAHTAVAVPTVLFDSGEAVPAAQYLSHLFSAEHGETPPGLRFVSFPMRTPGMTSGVLPAPLALKRPAWLAKPVFLVGADQRSRNWLTQHRDYLQRIGAQGIVVEAENLAAVRELEALAGVPMAPASMQGDDAQLGLRVYPVLIRMDGMIVQQVQP